MLQANSDQQEKLNIVDRWLGVQVEGIVRVETLRVFKERGGLLQSYFYCLSWLHESGREYKLSSEWAGLHERLEIISNQVFVFLRTSAVSLENIEQKPFQLDLVKL